MQEDSNQRSHDKDAGSKFGAHSAESHDGIQGKKNVQHTAADVNDMEQDVHHRESWEIEGERDGTEAYSEDELMGAFEEEDRGDEPASPEAAQLRELATIPEVETPSHKSKRRANTGDEHSLDRAERIKAARNLDFTKEKGNISTSQTSFVHFANEYVVDNLLAVGISLGNNNNHISSSVAHIKEIELGRLEGLENNEEKEEMENEEVNKLILNSLCYEIMDEVMDLGNAYPQDCKITPNYKPSSLEKIKSKRSRSKSKQNSSK
jgi:hypothetical protein